MVARFKIPNPERMLAYFSEVFTDDNIAIDNGDIVIKKNWLTNLKPLILEPQVKVEEGNIEILSNYILDNLNDDWGMDWDEISKEIRNERIPAILSELGIISTLKKAEGEFVLNTNVQIKRKILEQHLLPEIIKIFEPKICVAVKIKASLQQSILSVLKISYLIDKYKDYNLVKQKLDKNVGEGLTMAGGLPILQMMDVYNAFSNVNFNLPIKTTFSSFYFIGDGAIVFSREMLISLRNIFQDEPNIMLEDSSLLPKFGKVSEIKEDFLWRYLSFSVDCINNLFSYANNPFNFLDDDNYVKCSEQLQFLSAIHLLYADLISIHYTPNVHIKNHLSFSSIEKIANLVKRKPLKTRNGKELKESNLVHILLNTNTKAKIIEILSAEISQTKPDVFENIKSYCNIIYSKFHEKLHRSFSMTEEKNIGSFYNLRNFYAHGTFLNREQFIQNFQNHDVKIPSELSYLPFFISMALAVNPQEFLSYLEFVAINEYSYEDYRVD